MFCSTMCSILDASESSYPDEWIAACIVNSKNHRFTGYRGFVSLQTTYIQKKKTLFCFFGQWPMNILLLTLFEYTFTYYLFVFCDVLQIIILKSQHQILSTYIVAMWNGDCFACIMENMSCTMHLLQSSTCVVTSFKLPPPTIISHLSENCSMCCGFFNCK